MNKFCLSILNLVKRPYDIYKLKQCPVCKKDFDKIEQNIEPSVMAVDNVPQAQADNQLHMAKHFSGELRACFSTKGNREAFRCLLVRLRLILLL